MFVKKCECAFKNECTENNEVFFCWSGLAQTLVETKKQLPSPTNVAMALEDLRFKE
jgi:hypothetical protein